jgi:hypothetical protein
MTSLGQSFAPRHRHRHGQEITTRSMPSIGFYGGSRKVDVRLPEKGNSNSHGARPVHLIISLIKWIRTSRLSIKNFLSYGGVSPEF